jgi:hypothetical protein
MTDLITGRKLRRARRYIFWWNGGRRRQCGQEVLPRHARGVRGFRNQSTKANRLYWQGPSGLNERRRRTASATPISPSTRQRPSERLPRAWKSPMNAPRASQDSSAERSAGELVGRAIDAARISVAIRTSRHLHPIRRARTPDLDIRGRWAGGTHRDHTPHGTCHDRAHLLVTIALMV